MKYIIFQDFGGKPVPFIFPNRVEFVDMREQMPYSKVLSCGEVHLVGGAFICSGGDAELGVNANPEDAVIITELFKSESR